MRLEAVAIAFVAAGCASTPADDTSATSRACTFTDCFATSDVRDFQVIDQSTLIVFVGQQRCAFQVELRGAFCDMTFAGDLLFTRASDIRRNTTVGAGPTDPFGLAPFGSDNFVVCSNDLQVDVVSGTLADLPGGARSVDRFGNPRSRCQIDTIVSLTDDQLMDLYVARRIVPPPPPMGPGEIEVDHAEQGAATESPEPNASEIRRAGD